MFSGGKVVTKGAVTLNANLKNMIAYLTSFHPAFKLVIGNGDTIKEDLLNLKICSAKTTLFNRQFMSQLLGMLIVEEITGVGLSLETRMLSCNLLARFTLVVFILEVSIYQTPF